MLHIVIVLVIEAIRQVAILIIKSRRYLLELLGGHFWVQPMNLHLHTDKTVLCIIEIAHGFLNRFNACAWRTKHYWELAFLLGFRQISINAMTLVVFDLQQIHICLVRRIVINLLAIHVQRGLASLFYIPFPEITEVLGILGIGFQLLWRKTNLHVMLVLSLHTQFQVQKSRLLHSPHVDSGPTILQLHLTGGGHRHHVRTYLVVNLYILRHAVERKRYFHLRLLTHLVEPVSMIRYRQPQIVRAIGIILSLNSHHAVQQQ